MTIRTDVRIVLAAAVILSGCQGTRSPAVAPGQRFDRASRRYSLRSVISTR